MNHNPSLTTDSPIDEFIKKGLLIDTFSLLGIPQRPKFWKIDNDMYTKRMTKGKEAYQIEKQRAVARANKIKDRIDSNHTGAFTKIYP